MESTGSNNERVQKVLPYYFGVLYFPNVHRVHTIRLILFIFISSVTVSNIQENKAEMKGSEILRLTEEA